MKKLSKADFEKYLIKNAGKRIAFFAPDGLHIMDGEKKYPTMFASCILMDCSIWEREGAEGLIFDYDWDIIDYEDYEDFYVFDFEDIQRVKDFIGQAESEDKYKE